MTDRRSIPELRAHADKVPGYGHLVAHEMVDEIERLRTELDQDETLLALEHKRCGEALRLAQEFQADVPVWRRTADELPPSGVDVLIALDNYRDLIISSCTEDSEGKPYWIGPGYDIKGIEVTHWMPLPEPPEDKTHGVHR